MGNLLTLLSISWHIFCPMFIRVSLSLSLSLSLPASLSLSLCFSLYLLSLSTHPYPSPSPFLSLSLPTFTFFPPLSLSLSLSLSFSLLLLLLLLLLPSSSVIMLAFLKSALRHILEPPVYKVFPEVGVCEFSFITFIHLSWKSCITQSVNLSQNSTKRLDNV